MKRMTNSDVKDVAEELITLNGTTTTLEVKQALRLKGFFALQDEVSSAMSSLGFNFTENGTYRTYTSKTNVNLSKRKTITHKQKPTLVTNSNGTYTYTRRDGKSIDTVDSSNFFRKAWSITNSEELFFGPGCTRNEARFIYSKITGTKYSDTRVHTVS